MRKATALLILVLVLTVIFGFLDQAFGWIDIFVFLDWVLIGEGGLLEMLAHTFFLAGYVFMLVWGTFEGLLGGDAGEGILAEFTPIGFLSSFVQYILKGLGLVRAVIEFIVGIWAAPVILFIDALQVTLSVFNVSIQLFMLLPLTAFITGFSILLIYFFYMRSGISYRVRNIEEGNPLLGGISNFIRWLTGATPGEQVDNTVKQLLLNFVNARDTFGEPIVINRVQAPDWADDGIVLSEMDTLYNSSMAAVDAFNAPLEAIRSAFRSEESNV